MIDTICKRFISNPVDSGVGTYLKVTVSSIPNKAILMGYHHSEEHMVIYEDEIDNMIEALQELRGYIR